MDQLELDVHCSDGDGRAGRDGRAYLETFESVEEAEHALFVGEGGGGRERGGHGGEMYG